jgi:sirohydrochlorin ferrochelatase
MTFPDLEPIGASPEVTDEVAAMLRKTGISALQEAEQYIRKSRGASPEKTDLSAEFARRLSGYIT